MTRLAGSYFHPTGTCALGAVLGPRLEVPGVKGLRVADASVLPRTPGAGTVAACMMVGRRAADLVLNDAPSAQ
jgi:choline dehydrogenase